jgi:hypothetical protein
MQGSEKAAGGLKDAFGKLGGSLKNVTKAAGKWITAHGPMIGGAALIAAGVAVAVGAIAWGVSQYQRFEKAAEEAAL